MAGHHVRKHYKSKGHAEETSNAKEDKKTKDQSDSQLHDIYRFEKIGSVLRPADDSKYVRFLEIPVARKGTDDEMPKFVHKPQETMSDGSLDTSDMTEEKQTFEKALQELINKHSQENGSNTPDFILARLMCECLEAFNHATKQCDAFNKPNNEK